MWIATAVPVQAQLRYSGGLSYARGSYFFDQPLSAFYLTNRIAVDKEPVSLSVTMPFVLRQEGGTSWVAGTLMPTGGGQHGLVSGRRGGTTIGTHGGRHMQPVPSDSVVQIDSDYTASVGDPVVASRVELYSGFGFVRSLEVDGRAKIPMLDPANGSGTGEWDYALGSSVTVGLGRGLGYADATYWWIGDLPELELLDGVSFGAGALFPAFGTRASVLIGVSGSSKTIPTADAPLSLDASAGLPVGDSGFLSIGAGVGLTETAADLTLELGWSARFLEARRTR